jgi:hypothetical protein
MNIKHITVLDTDYVCPRCSGKQRKISGDSLQPLWTSLRFSLIFTQLRTFPFLKIPQAWFNFQHIRSWFTGANTHDSMNNSYTKRTFAIKTIQTQSEVLEEKRHVERRFSTAEHVTQSLEPPPEGNARHKFLHISVHNANQHHSMCLIQMRHARHWPVNSRTQC